jgi:hypothetical protein
MVLELKKQLKRESAPAAFAQSVWIVKNSEDSPQIFGAGGRLCVGSRV